MNKQNGKARIALTWVLLLAASLGSILLAEAPAIAAPLSAEQRQVQSVVSQYLNAWRDGDYALARQFWTTRWQSAVPESRLKGAFTLSKRHSPRLITGRPAAVKVTQVTPLSSSEMTADCVVDFNGFSEAGLSVEQATGLIKQLAKPSKAKDDKKAFGRALLLAGFAHTERVDTEHAPAQSVAREKTIDGQSGTTHIRLYARRFHLIQENGQWRIDNAVSL